MEKLSDCGGGGTGATEAGADDMGAMDTGATGIGALGMLYLTAVTDWLCGGSTLGGAADCASAGRAQLLFW